MHNKLTLLFLLVTPLNIVVAQDIKNFDFIIVVDEEI